MAAAPDRVFASYRDRLIKIADIDRSAVEQQLSDLRDDLSATRSEAERPVLEDRIAIAEAKLAALDTQIY